MIIAIIVCAVVFLLQMLYFDNVLITLYIASIGSLVIFLSLETPDYVDLLETKAELNEVREREAALQAKENLSHEVLLAFSKAVDAKDHYTNGHSERVARYAKEISRRMGKSVKEQDEIYELGLLHDVGKIGVPDSVINKPGRLTDEEYAQIKKHPVMGAEILTTVSEIPKLVTGARWHHERFDGKGYPDGLKGEDIPEEARIIAVADAYDAMTSHRSYRDIIPQDHVKSEIEKGMGTQFDEKFARIMLEMITEDTGYTMHE
jgi:putative nucleotidyltransferase with HDIG domain